MKSAELETRMQTAGVRPSPVRVLILRTLIHSVSPMSSQEIESALETVDRSSISRTLALFADRGLVHTVDDGSGSIKYEACRSAEHCHYTDNDLHPHFHCTSCGATFCFSSMHIPEIELPDGFSPVSINYVVKGLCPDCSVKTR